jgi:hypothetical protein
VTKRHFFITTLVAVSLAGRLSAQIDLGAHRFRSSEQLIASAGSESLAAEIVATVFSHRLFVRDSPGALIHILSRQIPESWLPKTSVLRFSRVDDDAARTRLDACGSLIVVQFLNVAAANLVQIAIAEAMKCQSALTVFTFERVGNEWRLPPNTIPGGGGTSTNHCQCVGSR